MNNISYYYFGIPKMYLSFLNSINLFFNAKFRILIKRQIVLRLVLGEEIKKKLLYNVFLFRVTDCCC